LNSKLEDRSWKPSNAHTLDSTRTRDVGLETCEVVRHGPAVAVGMRPQSRLDSARQPQRKSITVNLIILTLREIINLISRGLKSIRLIMKFMPRALD